MGEDRAGPAEPPAREVLEKMFDLRALVEGLGYTLCGRREQFAGVIDAKLVCIQLVITAVRSESKGMFGETICKTRDNFCGGVFRCSWSVWW